MYQIDEASQRGRAPKMSAFPLMTRPFTEPVTASSDMTIGQGVPLPDLIRKFYPGAIPHGFSGSFGFLDRDNKERTYDPAKTDPFVFNGMGSIRAFADDAHVLIKFLTDAWARLGLPVTHDKDRRIDVPDSGPLLNADDQANEYLTIAKNNIDAVYFILANVDIMKKACVVRTVNAGWWAVSYAGKNAPDKSYFSTSLRAHKRAIDTLLQSAKGRALYEKNWKSSSDPLTTNPGYPFFAANVDENGNPTTRIKTVELFRNLGRDFGHDWSSLLAEVDNRGGQFGMKGFPFAVAPIRRLQPGYKWQHQFNLTPSGLRTAFDERGVNSQRVAHMVPYVYNVLTSPMSALYKTARMLLPGTYHDGDSKFRRMKRLQDKAKKKSLFLMEADYSNFDRFMAVDLIEEIVSWFVPYGGNETYWSKAMLFLHHDASLVWPDFSSVSSGEGWLFKPGRLGLLSGVKATSDTGTLVNSVVNGEALSRTFKWTEDQLYAYLTQYVDAEVGSKEEYFYVQSDDTELIQSSFDVLLQHGREFTKAVKAAGLKGSIELADRFLMRHLQGGSDRPVPARVWQNTLSNETPPPSEIIFLAGLGSRTDGLLGLKTVDPFSTGSRQTITAVEAAFTKLMLQSIRRFVASAAKPSKTALQLLDVLLEDAAAIDAAYSESPSKLYTGSTNTQRKANNLRNGITKLLAETQLEEKSKQSPNSVTQWLYGLYKDQNIPSTQLMLSQLQSLSHHIASAVGTFAKKDEAFFRYAADTIGVSKLRF